jgi:hypothetical protein
MLAPHHKELLTAYVDGELNARQRRHVARLLHRSREARQLLERLQQDSREIRALPPCTPPRDVSVPVVDAIIRRNLVPLRVRRTPPPVRFPIWTGFAAAASVLLLVGLGTFLHYSRGPGRSDTGTTAQRPTNHDDNTASTLPAEKNVARSPKENVVQKETSSGQPLPPEHDPDSKEFVLPPDDAMEKVGPAKPSPRRSSEPVFASGAKESPGQLERVELPLPTLFKLSDLDQSGAARQLRDKLAAPGAYRIELLCKDASKTFGRVRTAFAANKIGLVADPRAQERLKKPLYRNDFAIFAENVTPAQLVRLLARLGIADRTPPADKKSPEPRFEGTVVVQPWSSWDRSELASLLKANPSPVPPRPAPRAPDVDIHKPLPEVTENEILQGKGVPRPTSGDQRAIFLSLSGTRSDSQELKRFVAQRKPLQTGTIQVFMVLRHVGP